MDRRHRRASRPREWDETESYFTPIPVGHQGLGSVATLLDRPPEVIVDLGAGAGGLGQVARYLWPRAHLVAVEIRPSERAHLARHYDEVIIGDALTCPLPAADLVMANPPFTKTLGLALRALQTVRPGGMVPFLTRQTLGDAEVIEALLHEVPPLLELTISGRVSMAAAAEVTKDNFGYQWLVWQGRGPRGGGWVRRFLPRLDNASLGWTARPGTGRMLPLDADLIVDLRPLVFHRQQLTVVEVSCG